MARFKECKTCGLQWESLDQFISDKKINFIGYQARFDLARVGLFLFNHSCGTTLAIPVGEFEQFLHLDTSAFTAGSAGCLGYCTDVNNLEPCTNTNCKGKPIRDLIQIIRARLNHSPDLVI